MNKLGLLTLLVGLVVGEDVLVPAPMSGPAPAPVPVPAPSPGSGEGCNENDISVISDDSFDRIATECHMKCTGEASCVADCLAEKTGLSQACAECFGDVTQCIADNCLTECATAGSQECASCTAESCPEFYECSNFPLPTSLLEASLAEVPAPAPLAAPPMPAPAPVPAPAGSGACNNPDDSAAFDDTFDETATECYIKCDGEASCSADCLVENAGLSQACAQCFADGNQCTVDNCLTECEGSDEAREECPSCLAENCPGLYDCAGFELD